MKMTGTTNEVELVGQPTRLEKNVGSNGNGNEPCPVCGCAEASEWLQGPDRFHGRQEKYTLVRCPACSLVWLSHPPKPAEMHLHYTDAYHKLISAAGENSPVVGRTVKLR